MNFCRIKLAKRKRKELELFMSLYSIYDSGIGNKAKRRYIV
jgi:hypothetical protein